MTKPQSIFHHNGYKDIENCFLGQGEPYGCLYLSEGTLLDNWLIQEPEEVVFENLERVLDDKVPRTRYIIIKSVYVSSQNSHLSIQFTNSHRKAEKFKEIYNPQPY